MTDVFSLAQRREIAGRARTLHERLDGPPNERGDESPFEVDELLECWREEFPDEDAFTARLAHEPGDGRRGRPVGLRLVRGAVDVAGRRRPPEADMDHPAVSRRVASRDAAGVGEPGGLRPTASPARTRSPENVDGERIGLASPLLQIAARPDELPDSSTADSLRPPPMTHENAEHTDGSREDRIEEWRRFFDGPRESHRATPLDETEDGAET